MDFLNRVLRIQGTKSGRPHALPLNATILATLQALYDQTDDIHNGPHPFGSIPFRKRHVDAGALPDLKYDEFGALLESGEFNVDAIASGNEAQNRDVPDGVDVCVSAMPVARFVTVTVASGTTAPAESFTVPVHHQQHGGGPRGRRRGPFAPAPQLVSLAGKSREHVMDENPWMYAASSAEMVREHRIDPAATPEIGNESSIRAAT